METIQKAKMNFFAYQVRVRYAEVDQLGIAYYAHYLVWLEVARVEYLRYLGITYAEVEKKGIKLPVHSCSMQYLLPARYDDLLNIQTRLSKIGQTSLTFEYEITNDKTKKMITKAETRLVCVDAEFKPIRIPKMLAEFLPLR